MTTLRTTPIASRRLSLPLSARDQADLLLIRESPDRLNALPGNIVANASDAALVHAVFEAGLARIRESLEFSAYQEMARDPEYREYHAARRRGAGRRRPE